MLWYPLRFVLWLHLRKLLRNWMLWWRPLRRLVPTAPDFGPGPSLLMKKAQLIAVALAAFNVSHAQESAARCPL